MAEIYRHVLSLTPCKGGCSFCCYYPVSICEIEIAFIERNAKKKRLKNYAPKSDFHGTACPFLEKGRCSIYDSRPFVCRRHVALTKTNFWCDPVRSNEETFSLLNFSGIEEAFDAIRRQSNSYDMFDIRQVFKGNGSDNHSPAENV
jgi:Fe-S-cluster containining protein